MHVRSAFLKLQSNNESWEPWESEGRHRKERKEERRRGEEKDGMIQWLYVNKTEGGKGGNFINPLPWMGQDGTSWVFGGQDTPRWHTRRPQNSHKVMPRWPQDGQLIKSTLVDLISVATIMRDSIEKASE